MSAPRSGVVTFLFTDVEGSTRRWQADGDGMRAALAARLGALYEMASTCGLVGRGEAAVGYSEAGQALLTGDPDYELPFGGDGVLGTAYPCVGQPERAVTVPRPLARGHDTHALTWAALVVALAIAGRADEATTAADGLIEAAGTRNPYALSNALWSFGLALRETDPDRALHALLRGVVIAQDSGSRANQSYLAILLSSLEAAHGDPLAALDYAAVAIRN